MLVREVISRHLDSGTEIALAADAELVADLDRAGRWTAADAWPTGGEPGLVVVDLGAGTDDVSVWTQRWPAAPVLVLLLRCEAHEVPVGNVIHAACAAGLHFVEAIPLAGAGYRVAVVATRRSGETRSYLTGAKVGGASEAAPRITWEWGLASFVSRALEVRLEQDVANTRERVAELEQLLSAEQQAHGDDVAVLARQLRGEARRNAKLTQSAAYVLGNDLVSVRRRPLRGTKALFSDGLGMLRSRQARRNGS